MPPSDAPTRAISVTPRRFELGLWALVAAAALHVGEEFLLGWRAWAEQASGLPVTWPRFWTVNAAFLVYAVMAATVGRRRPVLSLALPGLALVNGVVFHVGATLVFGRVSPGVFTAVALYLPLSWWTFHQAAAEGVLSRGVFIGALMLGSALMAVPVVAFALL